MNAEEIYESIGGDLCICQRADVSHWCEKCQWRIGVIAGALSQAAAPLPASAALQALIAEWRRSADCVEREIQPGGIRERFPEGPRYGIAAVRQCADELEAALSRADQP